MVLRLTIHFNNPNAPKPNRPITPGICAVIFNKKQEVLLHQREDADGWSLPGGKMKVGESISQCCVREIKEETNLDVKAKKIIGVYTSPGCVFEYSNGLVFQVFAVAFLCVIKSGKIVLNNESKSCAWFPKHQIKNLKTLPYVKKIISDALLKRKVFFD